MWILYLSRTSYGRLYHKHAVRKIDTFVISTSYINVEPATSSLSYQNYRMKSYTDGTILSKLSGIQNGSPPPANKAFIHDTG